MSDLLLHERVTLDQGRRTRYGLLSNPNVQSLPEGWEDGIVFRPIGCSEPQITAPCEVRDGVLVRLGDAQVFEPIWIAQSAACSTISQIGTTPIALDRLEATTEWGLGRLLYDAAGGNNPSLVDADIVTEQSADIPVIAAIAAVSCLEQAVIDTGFGAEVVLHAPMVGAAWLTAANLMVDGFSPSGFPWVISPGYGQQENGQVSIWATGTVWAGVNPAYVLRDGSTGRVPIGWQTNTDATFAQRIGLAAFDPCLLLSAKFEIPTCGGN